MKKNVFLAVAIATLAFVGCNKEENNGKVTLNLNGESYTSTDKQALRNNTLMFTTGDEAYVNGECCEIYGVNGREGKLDVELSEDGYVVNYPANAVSFQGNKIKTEFMRNVTLVSANPNITTTFINGTHQVWPMSGYAETAGEANVKLFNNVAILSPAVKYGPEWASAMWCDGGVDPMGWTYSESVLPNLYVTKVVFSSNDIKLTGKATLKNYDESYNANADVTGVLGPEFKMDNNPNGWDSIVCAVDPAFQAVPTTTASTSQIMATFGNLSIAPCMVGGKHMTITYYFNATVGGTTRYYKYSREVETGATFSWKRGFRTTLCANFYDMMNPQDFSAHLSIKNTPFGN